MPLFALASRFSCSYWLSFLIASATLRVASVHDIVTCEESVFTATD
jgi:hypothetical protein